MIQKVTLWPTQQEFFNAGPQPLLFMGGVGSGKSYIGIMKMLALLDQYPGSRGAIVRQRFQQLKKTTAATLWKLLPVEFVARRNDNDGILKLRNGSELLLLHLDKAESINNLKSLELNFAYVDQLEDVSADAWDTLLERLGRWTGATRRGGWPKDWPYVDRLGNRIPPRYAFASAYSPGFDHWITQRWWEFGTERARYREQGYKVVIGSTRDNLAISQDYLDSRLAMGSEYVKRFVDAVEWGAHEGRIFDINPLSILEPTPDLLSQIRRRMRVHRVYDHGEFSPAACIWYATDDRNNIFVYREYMKADRLVSEHRRSIYEMSKPDAFGSAAPLYHSNYADPAIFAKSRGRSVISAPTWSVADEWLDGTIVEPETAVCWRPADNNEEMTVGRLKEYLRVDGRHTHPITGKRGAPYIYFVRRTDAYPHGCLETLADIRNARRVELETLADGTKLFGDERDPKVRDHLLDCVRYAVGMRPSLAKSITREVEPGTINFAEYMAKGGRDPFLSGSFRRDRPKSRSGYGYGR